MHQLPKTSFIISFLVKVLENLKELWRLWFDKSVVAFIPWMIIILLIFVVGHEQLFSPVSISLTKVGVENAGLTLEAIDFIFFSVAHLQF